MADPKITFKLELDDSQISSQLNSVVRKISQLNNGHNVSVHVNANIAGAQSGMKTVQSGLNTLNGANAEVNLTANITDAQSGTDEIQADLNTLDGANAEVNVSANISDAQSGTDEVNSDMNALNGKTSTVHVNAEIGNAQSGIDTVESELNALDGRTVETYVNTNSSGSSDNGSDNGSDNDSDSSSGSSFLSSVGSLAKTIFTEGSEYEKSRAKASTLMPEGTDLTEWDSIVAGLSAKYGQSASSYNEAAYSMLSAGQSYENLPELLDLSSQLAVGGFTDVETAAGLLAKMGNAYGSTDYQQMANNALLTQNYGIIDVGPMARVMPQVNSVAANANVSMPNLMATMAAITHAGVQPEQAGTQVRALINELDKTGQTGQKTLASATGVKGATISTLMEQGWTMGDIARSIGDYSEKTGMTYADMFSSQEAGAAIANILSSDNGGTFDSAYQDMVNGVDAVTPAFETMAETTSFSLDQIMTQFQNAGIELFTALAPAIAKFLDVLTSDDFKESLSKFIGTLSDWLASDGLNNFIDALISASNWLLETFNSGKSLGEILGELFSKAITTAIPLITNVLIELVTSLGTALMNAIVEALPDKVKQFLGIEKSDTSDIPWYGKGTGAASGEETSGSTTTGSDKGTTSDGDTFNSKWLKDAFGLPEKTTETVVQSTTTQGGGGTTSGKGAGHDSSTTSSSSTGLLSSTASQLVTSVGDAASSIGTASTSANTAASKASSLASSLSRLASAVSSAIRRCNKIGTGGGDSDGNKSVGMSYVPFDGYVATLHKGEAVLTAAQASTYRMGGETSVSGIDYTALASAMAGMTMTMDSRTVGRIVERSVSQAQGARAARSMRGVRS